MRPRGGVGKPHYIDPTKTAPWPQHYLYLDTESQIRPAPGGEDLPFRLAVVAADHRNPKTGAWSPRHHVQTTSLAELWQQISEATRYGHLTVLLAHNLHHDYQTAQAAKHLAALGWTLDHQAFDTRELIWARWRMGRRSLLCCNLQTYIPKSLEAIGKLLGQPKHAMPHPQESDERWFTYCRRDVEILAEAWHQIVDWIAGEDLGGFMPTGAGLAWSVWRHRFMTHKVLARLDNGAQEAARRASWTGRREAWRHGELGPIRWHNWDLESAYALIGYNYDVPTRGLTTHGALDLERCAKIGWHRALLCEAEVQTSAPTVPCEARGHILWPVGLFRTTLWWEELLLAIQHGASVRVLRAWSFRKDPALRAFMEWCLYQIHRVDPEATPLRATVAKHLSRTLVGRFGVRYAVDEEIGGPISDQVGAMVAVNVQTGARGRLTHHGDRTSLAWEKREGDDAAPQVMSYVMMTLRVQLAEAMLVAGVGHVAQVDTDGLWVDADGDQRMLALKGRGWRHKDSAARLEIYGPAAYVADGQTRIAGIPRRAKRVGPATWEAEVWSYPPDLQPAGEAAPVRVRRRRIGAPARDGRRAHLPGGATTPYVVQLLPDGRNHVLSPEALAEPQEAPRGR